MSPQIIARADCIGGTSVVLDHERVRVCRGLWPESGDARRASPTDFHTATLVAGGIYVVGSLGYVGARTYGTTPVYRLDVESLRMGRLEVGGEAPGWIYEHRADLVGPNRIRVSGGKVVTSAGGEETHTENTGVVPPGHRSEALGAGGLETAERLVWCRTVHHGVR